MAKGRVLGMGRIYGQAAVARDIEECHAEGGEVKTYTLSPEELARYKDKPKHGTQSVCGARRRE